MRLITRHTRHLPQALCDQEVSIGLRPRQECLPCFSRDPLLPIAPGLDLFLMSRAETCANVTVRAKGGAQAEASLKVTPVC